MFLVGPPGFEPGTVRSLAQCYEPAALSVFQIEATWLSYGPSKNAGNTIQLLTLLANVRSQTRPLLRELIAVSAGRERVICWKAF